MTAYDDAFEKDKKAFFGTRIKNVLRCLQLTKYLIILNASGEYLAILSTVVSTAY